MAHGVEHSHLLVAATHNQPEYKLPWMIMDKKAYEAEMAWLLVTPNVDISPDEYDFHKGRVKYFHGTISRDEAEARIRQRGEHGAFLLRIGRTGHHVLSVASPDGIMHIEVKAGPKGGKCLGKGAKEFADVAQMIMGYYGRPVEGFGVEFRIPVPPSTRDIASDPALAKPDKTAAHAAKKKAKKEKKDKEKKKKKKREVRRIPIADIPTHELRALLEAHGIEYHHVNSRADLEALASGLEIKRNVLSPGSMKSASSTASLASTVSAASISTIGSMDSGPPSPPVDPSLLPPAAVSLLPPSSMASSKSPTPSGGLDLFSKYKAKVGGGSPDGNSLAVGQPRGRSLSARLASDEKPKVRAAARASKATEDLDAAAAAAAEIAAARGSASSATSGGEAGVSGANESGEAMEEKRLSAMAADFFGGLLAGGGDDDDDDDEDGGAVFAKRAGSKPSLGSVTEEPDASAAAAAAAKPRSPPPKSPMSPAAAAIHEHDDETTDDSDDSDDSTDSDDSDTEDSDDEDDDEDPHKFSAQLRKKLATGPPGGRPPPPANTAAAERQAKRKEKLRALAQGL